MTSPKATLKFVCLLGCLLAGWCVCVAGWRVSAQQAQRAFGYPLEKLASVLKPAGIRQMGHKLAYQERGVRRAAALAPPANTQTLTVTKTGTVASEGTVTSDVAGINCGPSCSANFNTGQMVTLTASVPNTALAAFLGWSGACTGRGPCTVTMDAAQNVTAQFETLLVKKCAVENANLWGLKFTLGANITPAQCSAQCLAGGGNGYSMVSQPAGFCLCGTNAKPVSTGPVTTGCTSTCVGTTAQCGGPSNKYSAYFPGNLAPSITAGGTVVRQQSAAAQPAAAIAVVDDAETAKGNLTVTAANLPTGITLGSISINPLMGAVSATVEADSTAALGNNTVTVQVTDGGGLSATANFTVNVIAAATGPSPLINFSDRCFNTTTNYYTNTNSSTAYTYSITVSPNTFTGTYTIGNFGDYRIEKPGPIGIYTFSVTASSGGVPVATKQFQARVTTPPTVTVATGVTVQAGSPPSAPVTIATVSDSLSLAGSLIVTQYSGAPDITLGSITNTNGIITATVAATCDGGGGSYQVYVQVADAICPFSSTLVPLTVNVTENSLPTLGNYASACPIAPGGSRMVTPSAPPSDNGAVTMLTATVSPASFTGSLSIDPATGAVTINNAGPIGHYTVTVQARDNCFYPTSKTFQFGVANNNPPTIAAATGVTRQGGLPVSNSNIATVADTESGPNGVTVMVTSANPSNGVTLSNLTNTNGTIKADIVADCKAVDASFTLLATDACGATSTTTLNVSVPKNTAPVLTYDKAQPPVLLGGLLTVNPLTGPSDEGTFSLSYLPDKNSTFTGTVTVDKTTGVVTISKAAPSGSHNIQIEAKDNCGLSTFASFPLLVSEPVPTLGNYPNATVNLSSQGTVTPQTAPTGKGSFTARTSTNFKGKFVVNPATGVVNVINAHPAGSYPVTVTATNSGGMVSKSFTLTVTSTPACPPGLLASAVHYSTDAGVVGLALGDFNNDGKQDLATTNRNAGTVTVTPGNGDGTFGKVQSFSSYQPSGIAAGDFNGDGWQDLAVGVYEYQSVQFYIGSSKGSFTLSGGTGTLFQSNGGLAFATTDFNHDGKLDLVAAPGNGSGVVVLLGGGDGTFHTPAKLAIGGYSSAVVVGDFNQDGHADIANSNGQAVAVALGNGDGTFAAAVDYAVSSFPRGLALGDFNGDGKQDLATANGDSTISILPGNGNGTFAAAQSFSIATEPIALATGDFNADGKQDLVVSGYQDSSVSLFLGNGDGTFGAAANQAVGTNPNSVVVGDFNGDGLQDLATGNYGSSGVSVLLRQCNTAPAIAAATGMTQQQGSTATQAILATVSDAEQTAASLTVAVLNAPPGITVNSLTNNYGALTALVTTDCQVAPGDHTVELKVTDAGGLSTTANLIIKVTANSIPTITYAAPPALTFGGAAQIPPASASDNGSIASFAIVSVTPPFSVTPTISAAGVISITNAGLPGVHNLVIRATDNCGAQAETTLAVSVACPTITLSALPNGTAGTAYQQTIAASPAGGGYTFAVSSGALPPGLTLNSATGGVSGTPTAAGNYAFAITATGWSTCTKTQAYNVVITASCTGLTLGPATLPNPTLGVGYQQTLNTTGGTGPFTCSVTQGNLPSGLTLDAQTGVLGGTPTGTGTFIFRVTVTNQSGCTGSRQYVLTVGCGTPTFSPTTLPNGVKGVPYSKALSVSPAGNYTFSIMLGQLPHGYTMSSTGLISGITNQTGTFNFTVKVMVGTCQSTKSYSLIVTNTAAALALHADYDGDGRSDHALWGTEDGTLDVRFSGRADKQASQRYRWGAPGDVSLLGDYDGDGKTDLAVFRPSDSTWRIQYSSDGSVQIKAWGLSTDTPVPGDYDGDGKTDLAVWRRTEGIWHIWRSSDQQQETATWGAGNAPFHDLPVPGDYDGDGRTDLAVFRRGFTQVRAQAGVWYVRFSGGGQSIKQWGSATDAPMASDYDGDGKTDLAVWCSQTGAWYILPSSTGTARIQTLGTSDTPNDDQSMPGDYDGDGKADLAVWRAAKATWHLLLSTPDTGNATHIVEQGRASDVPVSKRRL
jgi:hypothetical protein